jgi:catechol 2,3-dioxygenase-like lactoylglutathione lyase family enzyme
MINFRSPVHDGHAGLHGAPGRARGEHGGRSGDPIIRVTDLAWLEFEKPDIDSAERFALAFGFGIAVREPNALYLRGSLPGTFGVIIRKAPESRFAGMSFKAASATDLLRLSDATNTAVQQLNQPGGGSIVRLRDPSGFPVGVVYASADLPGSSEHHRAQRINGVHSPSSGPAQVQRLGHLALQTTQLERTLDWYLDTLGMIVSDFQYVADQRDRGPMMAFVRCDRGSMPVDHNTLALHLGPMNSYTHSAYQVADHDTVAAGGEYLGQQGYHRAWGIGRHILGNQIFDYWNDPDKLLVGHVADGDLFDSTVDTRWSPMTASGLAQWGPPVSLEFLGAKPSPRLLHDVLKALRSDNEISLGRLLGIVHGICK